MKIIAMIPARMGSKRIPKKNIRLLNDKPLIKYAIDNAIDSNEFESIWLNSEDKRLKDIALKSDIMFHQRPSELATDTATNREFTAEFLEKHECDYVVMINTTSPLLKVKTIKHFCSLVRKNNFDTILSTVSEKAEVFFQKKPLNFNIFEKVNSQKIQPVDIVVWALTAWKRNVFLNFQREKQCPVFSGRLGFYSKIKKNISLPSS